MASALLTAYMTAAIFNPTYPFFSEDVGPEVFPVRPNQNKANKYIVPYITDRIHQIVAQTPECRFAFYNGTMAYNLPSDLYQYFICLNSRKLLQWLNSKPDVKRWLSDCGLPVLPYETFLGQEITADILKQRFPQTKQYVIQSNYGGGGIGTFLVSIDYFDEVQPQLQPLRQYLVSAYVKYGVSVNTHIFIADIADGQSLEQRRYALVRQLVKRLDRRLWTVAQRGRWCL